MMRQFTANLLLICLCFGMSSCCTRPEPLNVHIPAGLVTVTDAQAELIANVKTLSRCMSLHDAKRHLGPPSGEMTDSLHYHLTEDRAEGGYYVTATLSFSDGHLSDAKVAFGHETRVLQLDE